MGDATQTDEAWAVVELMGHVKLAGRLSEVERFGSKMGRLDIPTAEGFITQFFGGSSVYRITHVSEEVARHVASRTTGAEPVHAWEFPKRLGPAAVSTGGARPGVYDDGDEGDPDDRDDDRGTRWDGDHDGPM